MHKIKVEMMGKMDKKLVLQRTKGPFETPNKKCMTKAYCRGGISILLNSTLYSHVTFSSGSKKKLHVICIYLYTYLDTPFLNNDFIEHTFEGEKTAKIKSKY